MLFDFLKYVDELREKEDKKTIVEKYEVLHGPFSWTLKDQIWFREYVSKFAPVEYQVPNLWKDDFDRDLLCQLVSASFSSEVLLDMKWEEIWLPEMTISVENEGNVISKMVNELYPFQIDRLYQIYVEEQMNLQNHLTESIKENEKGEEWDKSIKAERDEIIAQREYRLKRWGLLLETMDRKVAVVADQKDREEKLGSLYDQL
jgi:hypothetical protein